MRNRVIAVGSMLGVIILIGVFALAFWMVRHPGQSLLKPKVLIHQLLVVDFDNDNLLDESELLHGADAVIAVHDADRDELFSSMSMLQHSDVNQDERLDANDPIFHKLRLVFFTDNGKGRRYESFEEAGIKAITIYKESLTTNPNVIHNPADNLAGYAIMKDGSKRPIRLVIVQ